MIKHKIVFLLALAITIVFASCDIIEGPYVENTGGGGVAGDPCLNAAPDADDPFAGVTIQKKVMLEEFTGHTCGNCPAASEIAVNLRDVVYKDQMILLSVHEGGLAEPKTTGTKFTADFRTDEGKDLFDFFFPADAVPFGLINRIENGPDFYLFDQFKWETKVGEQLALPAEAGIIITNCYTDSSRELVSIIDVKFLVEGTDKEYLAVYLVEDEVVSWQKDYRLPAADQDVEEYHHHDMLRGTLNGAWGLPLSDEIIPMDQTFRLIYNHELDPGYDAAHCKIVAFIHNFDTREIRQVEVANVQ